MAHRRSIAAADIAAHKNPIPAATVVGNMVFTSAILGKDPHTNEMPGEPEAQIDLVFRTMRAIMREAGGTVEDIAKVSVSLRDDSHRKLVNRYWLDMFPDAASRPVRHTTVEDLPGGRHVQAEFIAVLRP